MHEKERRILEAPLEGVVLRYGVFYGPRAGSTRYMARMLRRRLLGLPGGGRGMASWIHVEDAAAATVAAAEREDRGGVYNVVDDEPVTFRASRRSWPGPSALGARIRSRRRWPGPSSPTPPCS